MNGRGMGKWGMFWFGLVIGALVTQAAMVGIAYATGGVPQ